MLLDQLVTNLNQQIKTHEILLDALIKETALPATCSLPLLEDIQTMRDNAVNHIKKLEAKRIQILKEYCFETNIAETVSLKDVISSCNETYATTLVTQRDTLKELIRRIADSGKQNAVRASARIACFNEIQGAVSKALKRSTTYSMNGALYKPKGACLMQRSV